MKILSVNAGLPRDVMWHGKPVATAIYKTPVSGRVALRRFNFDGDGQADLTVHGGAFKAVYCYPFEHYARWATDLPGKELPIAIFGENLTTEGVNEDSVHVGDEWSIGTARVVVTQPRLPCYKLGVRFGSDAMVKRFLASGRTGFYLAVLQEGQVGARDPITLLARDPDGVRVSDITRLYVAKTYSDDDVTTVHRALRISALPESWKEHLRGRL